MGRSKVDILASLLDTETKLHCDIVTEVALHLGKTLRLPDEELYNLKMVTHLHDIGKVKIPINIINKRGKLTVDEYKLIMLHSSIGDELYTKFTGHKDNTGIIRHHHEKWNGEGYPDKLRGIEIPLLARIVAIADVYEALRSARPYKNSWSHNKTSSYILTNGGSMFDPNLTAVYYKENKAIDKLWVGLRNG